MSLKEKMPETIGNINHGQVSAAEFNKHEKIERYRNGIADFFRRVNSTLAGRTVHMKWADPDSLPNNLVSTVAFTDGESVFINDRFFEDSIRAHVVGGNLLSAVGPIARMKGASYHELAHILYTPRLGTQAMKDVLELAALRKFECRYSEILRSFNMLEDQRIETRFSAKYRSAVPYFSLMSAEHIARFNERDPDNFRQVARLAFPLLYGRRFMSDMIPQAEKIHRDYIKDNGCLCDVDSLKAIIDEYRSIVFPSDTKRALELVRMFDEYMIELFHPPMDSSDPNSPREPGEPDKAWTDTEQDGHEYRKKGTPVRTADQRHDAQDANEWIDDMDASDDDDTEGSAESSAEDSDDGDEKSGSGQGIQKGGDQSGDDNGNGNGDGDSESGSSSGVSAEGGSDVNDERDRQADDVAQFVRELLDAGVEYDMNTRADAMSDVKNINKALTKARRHAKPDRRGAQTRDVTPLMRHSSRKIQDTFAIIRAEGEDIWQAGQSTGRLNVRDMMNSRGLSFDVFDEWIDLGDEATSFEVVILVDQSSSMCGFEMRSVSSALWVIRHACIAMDVPVTAIGYDNSARLLYSPSCPISNVSWDDLKATGGTDPDDAIEWALQIFSTSQATHKLLFSLTDGEWSWGNSTSMLMSRIRALGVHSTLILQGAWEGYYEGGQYDPYEVNKYTSKKIRFRFPSVPAATKNYGHERQVRISDSERDLPEVVSKAMEKLAVASLMAV